jgi:hypothetical protein
MNDIINQPLSDKTFNFIKSAWYIFSAILCVSFIIFFIYSEFIDPYRIKLADEIMQEYKNIGKPNLSKEISKTVSRGSSKPRIAISYKTDENAETLLAYYDDALIKNGWFHKNTYITGSYEGYASDNEIEYCKNSMNAFIHYYKYNIKNNTDSDYYFSISGISNMPSTC